MEKSTWIALAAAAALAACGPKSTPDPGASLTAPDAGEPPPPVPTDGSIEFGTPGPWPADPVTRFGKDLGLDADELVDVSTDEAQNLWVVSHQALYLLTPGAATFRRFTAADGLWLHNAEPPGITAVAGGAPGEVFVGYHGADVSDPQRDPNRFKGKLDRALLQPDGSLAVYHYDIHNNDAVGFDADGNVIRLPDGSVDPHYTDWSFNEDRTVERFLYDHLFHRGTLYVGYSHGVGRIDAGKIDPTHGFDYADHIHPVATNSAGTDRMGEWRALALDPATRTKRSGGTAVGNLWMGGRWAAGAATWTPSLFDWTRNSRNPFWIAMSNPPVFPVAEGEDVFIFGIAPLSDGTVYFASGPGNWGFSPRGVAMWKGQKSFQYLSPEGDIGLPSRSIIEMQRLPDDTIVFALSGRSELWRWNPKPEPRGQAMGELTGAPGAINRVYVDQMVKPTAIWLAGKGGVTLLRVP